MNYNSARLPLILEIGLIASQARFTDWLDKQFPIILREEDDPHDVANYFLATELRDKAEYLVRKLVCMDVTFRFKPECSALLTEYGLLEHYRAVRDHIEDPDLPFDPWPDLRYPYLLTDYD